MSTWNSTDGAPGPSPTCKSFSAWGLLSFLLQPDWILRRATERCPCPSPWSLWILPYMAKKTWRGAVSAGCLSVLRWRGYPGLSRWPYPWACVSLQEGRRGGPEHWQMRKRPCDPWGRNWSDVAISQGMPGLPEAGESRGPILPYII